MKTFLKENFAVVLAFALPLLLIIGVALSTYIPSFLLKTDYNFIYLTCTDGSDYYTYRCIDTVWNRYKVVDGKVVEKEIDPLLDTDKDGIPDVDEGYRVHFFLHDTESNVSKEITFEEVQSFEMISDLRTSPDGVTVVERYDGGPDLLFFDGGSSNGYYLTKGSRRTRLNLATDGSWYYGRYDFNFVGWVLPNK